MASKKTFVVAHPKLNLRVKLKGDEKAKVQRVPQGFEVDYDPKDVQNLVKSGKLVLKTGKTAEAEPEAESKKGNK